jgi:predicted TIM-barrel fold metal-dependent hydrolase
MIHARTAARKLPRGAFTLAAVAALGLFAGGACTKTRRAPGPKRSPKKIDAENRQLKAELVRLERIIDSGNKKAAPWKIVNFHDHAYKEIHTETYVAAAQAVGVVKTVLVASPKFTIYGKGHSKKEGFEENFQEILRISERWPGQFIPFTAIDPADPEKLAKVKRHHSEGAKGLKLYSGHSIFYEKDVGLMPPGMGDVLNYCGENNMPVLWHVRMGRYGKEFEEEVLKKFPHVTFVVAHYGVAFWRPEGKLMDDLPRLLDTYKNLYFDTCLGTRKILVDGLVLMGKHRERFKNLLNSYPDRFVIGTDMVITGNPEKTVSWMGKVLWAVRDQMEQDEFRFDLAAAWSRYYRKKNNPDGKIKGFALDDKVLKQIYQTNAMKLLGLKEL